MELALAASRASEAQLQKLLDAERDKAAAAAESAAAIAEGLQEAIAQEGQRAQEAQHRAATLQEAKSLAETQLGEAHTTLAPAPGST